MDNSLDLKYERLLGEGSYGKVFLVKQEDGQQVKQGKQNHIYFVVIFVRLCRRFLNMLSHALMFLYFLLNSSKNNNLTSLILA